MNSIITIAGREITQSNDFHSLSDIHAASGYGSGKHPSKWISIPETLELIEEDKAQSGEGSGGIKKCGEDVMASPSIAVAYAAWISPSFHMQVLRVFLAYRRGELVHSSTPPELRARLDSLVEAKAKGLITGFNANQMALEAIRSNWHKLPALPAGDTDTMPIFQVLLRAQVKVSGDAFLEPRMMTIYEAAVTAKDGEYGAEECLNALNKIGIDLHHGSLAINPGNQDLCDLLRLRGPSVLKDALLTEPGMVESKVKVMVGLTPCKPLLIPLGSL